MPPNPTVTSWEPVQARDFKVFVVPEFRRVQDLASGEVRMVPCPPTVTSWVPVQTRAWRPPLAPEGTSLQRMPSGEVAIVLPVSSA